MGCGGAGRWCRAGCASRVHMAVGQRAPGHAHARACSMVGAPRTRAPAHARTQGEDSPALAIQVYPTRATVLEKLEEQQAKKAGHRASVEQAAAAVKALTSRPANPPKPALKTSQPGGVRAAPSTHAAFSIRPNAKKHSG